MAWLEEQISGIREMKLWNLYTFQNNELKNYRRSCCSLIKKAPCGIRSILFVK